MKVSLKRAAGLNSADFANACIPLSTAKSAGLAQGATLHPLQQKEGKMPLQQVRAKVIISTLSLNTQIGLESRAPPLALCQEPP